MTAARTWLINRTDAIGDTVLTLVVAELIKKKSPQDKVIFLVSQRVQDLMESAPFVDEVWCLDRSQSVLSQYVQLTRNFKGRKIDHYLYVGGSHLPSWFAFMKRVKWRGGIVSRWPSFLFLNRGLRQRRSSASPFHESHYNLTLLEEFYPYWQKDYDPRLSQLCFDIGSTSESRLYKQTFALMTKPWPNYIIIHPGMTGHTLNWPMNMYAQLIKKILEQNLHIHICLSMTPSDFSYIEELKSYWKSLNLSTAYNERLHFIDGSTNGLIDYMQMLKGARLFLGPSTGTTHLANLLRVPTFGIYSPVPVQSKERWAPLIRNEETVLFSPDVQCPEIKSCAGESCPYYDCMQNITIERVYSEMEPYL